MKKTTLVSKCRNRELVDVTVYGDGPLFVGRMLNRQWAQKGRWTIYHHEGFPLYTGDYNGNGFATRKKACEVMAKLSVLTDWTQDSQAITNDYKLFTKVKAIYARA